MKPKNCIYCGEREAETMIADPNGKLGMWDVCIGCKKVIIQQQQYAFGHLLKDRKHGREIGNKMINESEQELERLAKEEGLESCTFRITKKKQEDE